MVHNLENRLLNPLEIMGIILRNQNLNITSGYFEFLMAYNSENSLKTDEDSIFHSHFPDSIKEYKQRKLLWKLPEKFLFDLTQTLKLDFLFQIEIEAPSYFFVGVPGKLKFSIQRNLDENIEVYNKESMDYYLSIENFSKNWVIIGNIRQKINIVEENYLTNVEFLILPLVVGFIELPKFHVYRAKNILSADDLEKKENDIENKSVIKNSELLINYVNGNNVLVRSYEKIKAEYAVFV